MTQAVKTLENARLSLRYQTDQTPAMSQRGTVRLQPASVPSTLCELIKTTGGEVVFCEKGKLEVVYPSVEKANLVAAKIRLRVPSASISELNVRLEVPQLSSLNMNTNTEAGTETIPDSGRITIFTDTSETLELDINNLIYVEAEGNYCLVKWWEAGRIRKKLIRIIIKDLHEQLNYAFIERCHRSFLVNVNQIQHMTGNSRGYRLHSDLIEEAVPVSRSEGPRFVELFGKKGNRKTSGLRRSA